MKMLTLLGIFIFSISAYAINGRTTYQAKIIKPDGYALESANVNFRFTVLDVTGSCVMYVEDYAAVNMTSSGGLISFALGTGVVSFPASATATTFSTMFDNSVTSFSCQTPGIYNPIPTDNRKIVMQFNDGSGWQTLPAMAINAVPYAMYAAKSQDSQKLNGKADTAFVQNSSLPTCVSGEALKFNGVSFSCVAVTGGSGVTSVTTSGTVLSNVGTASAPVISITAASMSADGYLTSLDYAQFKAKLAASSTQIVNTLGYAPVSGSAVATQISSSQLSGDVSGTISSNSVVTVGGKTAAQISTSVNDTLAASSGNAVSALVKRDSSGNFTANDIYANAAKTNYVDIYKPSTSFNIRLQAPTSLSTNYVLNLPTASGTTGQILSTDGSGNLSWINPSTGSVVSVSATAPLASTGGSNPTISITQATSSTNGYLSSSDWNTFSNKQAATSAAIIATLGYTPADNAASGTYAQKANNLSDLTSSATARTNLGLGTLATANSIDLGSASATGIIADARLVTQTNVTSGTQYTKVTVDGKGRVTSGAQLSSSDVTTALGYTPANDAASGTYLVKANNLSDLTNIPQARTNLGLGGFATVSSLDLGTASATGTLAVGRLPAFIGDATIATASNTIVLSNSGVTAGTYTKVTVDSKGRVTSSSALSSSDVTTALGYTPANSTSGVTSLNGSTSQTQTFASSNAGTAFGISTSNGVHTFAIPLAASSTVTAGLLSNADYTTFTNKQNATSAAIIATLGYTPANATSATQWTTNGSNIYYNTGNIGVGIVNPSAKLELASGTASVAPLRFTSGTLLSSAQSGTMEYDGFNFYLTDSTNTRRSIATGSSVGTIDNASTINSSGNITMVPVGSVIVSSTTASTNSSTGALVVKGGLGVAGNINTAGNLNVSGATTLGGSLTLPSMTSGSVLFAGTGGQVTQDNSNFYYDSVNKRLGIGSNSPAQTLSVSGASYFSGNVGIGTTIPTAKFEVVTSQSEVPSTVYNSIAGTLLKISGRELAIGTADTPPYATYFQSRRTDNSANDISLNPSGGSVGIGTVAPQVALEVSGAIRVPGVGQIGPSGGYGYAVFQAGTNNFAGQMYGTVSGVQFTDNLGGNTVFIKNGGNVGIGTVTPNAKLEVSGNIKASGTYINVLNLDNYTATVNGLKIKTNIPFLSDEMPTVIIEGFDYRAGRSIGLILNWYGYAAGSAIIQHSVASFGGQTPAIQLSNEAGKVIIHIGRDKSDQYYNKLSIRVLDTMKPASYYSGWTWADEAVSGTSTVTVPYINRVGNLYADASVGIGTTNPEGALAIAGNNHGSASSQSVSLGRSGAYSSVELKGSTSNTGGGFIDFGYPSNDFAGRIIYENTDNSMSLYTASAERFRISSTGNVGIGITTPVAALHVSGTKGLRLESTASQYGFMHSIGNIHISQNADFDGVWKTITTGKSAGFQTNVPANEAFRVFADNTSRTAGTDVGAFLNPIFVVKTDGNVGIGTTAPGYTLDVSGTLRVTGTAYTNGGYTTWTAASDKRLKDIHGSYDRGLDDILGINIIKFQYKADNKMDLDSSKEFVGVTAQNLQTAIPEAVTEETNGKLKGYLTINTTPVLWTLINAVKQLYKRLIGVEEVMSRQIASIVESKADKAEIELLKQKAANLETKAAKVDKLESENAALKAYLCSKDPVASICK